MDPATWRKQPSSYRMGYVEGYDGNGRDSYLLQTGAKDIAEYERGYADGSAERTANTEPAA
jgi:hypothetical protein